MILKLQIVSRQTSLPKIENRYDVKPWIVYTLARESEVLSKCGQLTRLDSTQLDYI